MSCERCGSLEDIPEGCLHACLVEDVERLQASTWYKSAHLGETIDRFEALAAINGAGAFYQLGPYGDQKALNEGYQRGVNECLRRVYSVGFREAEK